jgi:hypothetical protein
MSLICNCPVGASLTDIDASLCPEGFGQIQKVVFQRIYSSGATKNSFVKASADPKSKASWTAKLAASDGTKVVQSPYLSEPVSEPGAVRTYGGGNAPIRGIPITIGREATTFTGKILQQPQAVIKQMKSLECESIGVYLIDENGRIGMLADNPVTPTTYYPIPVTSFFVSDKAIGGLEAPDHNIISWSFLPNWSDNLVMVQPTDFNALTDLVTPAS